MAFGASTARASTMSLNDFSLTSKLVSLPAHLEVNVAGLSEYDKKSWSVEKQDDGTEIYTFKKKPEARAAIMRNAKGELESMTTYKVTDGQLESAGSLIFENGTLRSFSSCETQDSVGRVCVTATPDLCHAIKAGHVEPKEMKQMDTFEMRALAVLLTLRGSDHQLENMVKTGNRLGLKSALQTTKGQLIALSKEIERETRTPSGAVAQSNDDKLAKSVLEKSLPRLKQACLDTRFN
jgi:hypothetical protein